MYRHWYDVYMPLTKKMNKIGPGKLRKVPAKAVWVSGCHVFSRTICCLFHIVDCPDRNFSISDSIRVVVSFQPY